MGEASNGVRRTELAIVGFGLIGASLAASLKRAGADYRITAVVRTEASADEAVGAGLADRAVVGTAAGVAGADIVLLAVPMLAMREALEAVRPALKAGAIVTDAGSVKARFVEDARAVFGDLARVVPGHPIAGREKSGMAAADAALYVGRRVLLTPVAETGPAAVDAVTRLWEAAGAEVECLTPEHHDRVLAATSHLPHVLAFALVDALRERQEAEEIFRYAAGGFRDFTRIASSDPVMWRDVCLTNTAALLDALDDLEGHLAAVRGAIADGDGEALETIFRRARAARDGHASDPRDRSGRQILQDVGPELAVERASDGEIAPAGHLVKPLTREVLGALVAELSGRRAAAPGSADAA